MQLRGNSGEGGAHLPQYLPPRTNAFIGCQGATYTLFVFALHVRSGLPNSLSTAISLANVLFVSVITTMRATRPAHFIVISRAVCRSSINILRSLVPSSHLFPNIPPAQCFRTPALPVGPSLQLTHLKYQTHRKHQQNAIV